MKKAQEELDDLEVLERVMDYHGSPTLRGKRPAPAQYMGLLRFEVGVTPRYAAALQRLIDRQIVAIVRAQNAWVLAAVGNRAAAERDRLRAETSDPAVYLKHLHGELLRVQADLGGELEDPAALLEQGRQILEQVIQVVEGMDKKIPGGGKA